MLSRELEKELFICLLKDVSINKKRKYIEAKISHLFFFFFLSLGNILNLLIQIKDNAASSLVVEERKKNEISLKFFFLNKRSQTLVKFVDFDAL